MVENNASFLVNKVILSFFTSKMEKESLKSLVLGSFLFVFFSFFIYMREGHFSSRFLLEMIFPVLFYFFAFLLRDIWLIPQAVNSVIVSVKFYNDELEVETSEYNFIFRSLKSKKYILKRNKIRVSKGDFFIKNKEYNNKTILLETVNNKFYLLPDFFPEEIKDYLQQ